MGVTLTEETLTHHYNVTGVDVTGEGWQLPIIPDYAKVRLRRAPGQPWQVEYVRVEGVRVLSGNKPGKDRQHHHYGGDRVPEAPPCAQDAITETLHSVGVERAVT